MIAIWRFFAPDVLKELNAWLMEEKGVAKGLAASPGHMMTERDTSMFKEYLRERHNMDDAFVNERVRCAKQEPSTPIIDTYSYIANPVAPRLGHRLPKTERSCSTREASST